MKKTESWRGCTASPPERPGFNKARTHVAGGWGGDSVPSSATWLAGGWFCCDSSRSGPLFGPAWSQCCLAAHPLCIPSSEQAASQEAQPDAQTSRPRFRFRGEGESLTFPTVCERVARDGFWFHLLPSLLCTQSLPSLAGGIVRDDGDFSAPGGLAVITSSSWAQGKIPRGDSTQRHNPRESGQGAWNPECAEIFKMYKGR